MSDDRHPFPPSTCPYCGNQANTGISLTGTRPPLPGDMTVCVSCAQPLRFDAALAPQKLTPEDEAAIDAQPGLREQLETVAAIIRGMDRRNLPGEPKAGSS